jgi:hypothetical protein
MTNKISRSKFVTDTVKAAAGLAVGSTLTQSFKSATRSQMGRASAFIPMPIQVVIDDVGWRRGENGTKRQEPFRTGINRNHVPADYQAIVDLGVKLGVRPQAATILCEWDRKNILRDVPTATWMREKWDNSKLVGSWMDEAADIIRKNRNHYELTLHGVGHEYWADEHYTRAEWADLSGTMRPLDQVELHLDYFAKLLDQNQLGPFPTAFVPTDFLHGFGLTGDHKISMAQVVKKRGIKYINTPFYTMYNVKGAQFGSFGIDSGVITIDRGNDLVNWNVLGGKPEGELKGPTCGMHWPNLLHEDPQRNSEIVDGWVKFLKPYNDKPETLLAPDSSTFRNQLVHHICTTLQVGESDIKMDFTGTDKLKDQLSNNQLTMKISFAEKLTFQSKTIKITSSKATRENDTWLHTVALERLLDARNVSVLFEAH